MVYSFYNVCFFCYEYIWIMTSSCLVSSSCCIVYRWFIKPTMLMLLLSSTSALISWWTKDFFTVWQYIPSLKLTKGCSGKDAAYLVRSLVLFLSLFLEYLQQYYRILWHITTFWYYTPMKASPWIPSVLWHCTRGRAYWLRMRSSHVLC